MKSNQGFTLVELMVTISILAILAAIAYSSYTRYLVRNAESRVETKMQSVVMELERFRSSRLTYRGFVPKKVATNGTESYGYNTGSTTDIDAVTSNSPYVITLVGTLPNTNLATSTGNQWHMFATPTNNAPSGADYKYYMSSLGHRCKGKGNDFVMPTNESEAVALCSKTGVEAW